MTILTDYVQLHFQIEFWIQVVLLSLLALVLVGSGVILLVLKIQDWREDRKRRKEKDK